MPQFLLNLKPQVQTIVFDLDDTLFAESEYVLSGFRAVDAWLSATYSTSGFYDAALDGFSKGIRGRIFDEALAKIGIPYKPEFVGRLVEVYRGHTPKLTLLAD